MFGVYLRCAHFVNIYFSCNVLSGTLSMHFLPSDVINQEFCNEGSGISKILKFFLTHTVENIFPWETRWSCSSILTIVSKFRMDMVLNIYPSLSSYPSASELFPQVQLSFKDLMWNFVHRILWVASDNCVCLHSELISSSLLSHFFTNNSHFLKSWRKPTLGAISPNSFVALLE